LQRNRSLMSELGHQRRFEHAPGTSALPPISDVSLSRSKPQQTTTRLRAFRGQVHADPQKTTRPPTKAISSWRYCRFQHFGWLGPPHIGQSAAACCAVSTFALQPMILQFATPFRLQFWIKSASACAWVASAKSLCTYPRLSLPSVPFIPHPQPAQAPVTVAAVSPPAMPRPKTIFFIDIALLNASDGTMS
jgi:hypothetical protein